MKIIKSQISDLQTIVAIYEEARSFMKSYGNSSQWGDYWPPSDVVTKDIQDNNSYLIIGDDGYPHAVFALIFGDDPDYENIEGEWPNQEPYAVIHRIASDGKIKGVLSLVVDFAKKKIDHIRIDTHKDNAPMLCALNKAGFVYCGIIHLEEKEGQARLAFAL